MRRRCELVISRTVQLRKITLEAATSLFNLLGTYVWGPFMLALLAGTGLYFTLRLGFLQLRLLPYALGLAFSRHQDTRSPGDITQFQALMTALAGTIGTGNIAGVATAVVAGGPGAVFWMWITALLGMATKYAEGLLAVRYRVRDENGNMSGGPMYYIERGLGMKRLASAFALFGMVAALGTGSSVQSNSVAHAMIASFGVPVWITGLVLTAATAMVILGGICSIARAASLIVPVMAGLYVLGAVAIVVCNAGLLLPALKLILADAFTGNAVAGGALGTVIRMGVARGVFSNEAGLGSAPIAAAAAKTDEPVRQALVSMTGTFIDTLVVCTMTGLVLVMGGLYQGDANGAALTAQTFDALLPGPGGWIVTIGLVFFSYSTILGWSYYGEKCAQYLMGTRVVRPYRVLYTLFVMGGAVLSLDLVWAVSDVFNGMMALPNLVGLLLLSGVIIRETRTFIDSSAHFHRKISVNPREFPDQSR